MTLAVYPALRGLDFDVTKTPIWSTDIQAAASGAEYRRARWSYPIWEFGLKYEFLRERLGEFRQLVGFYNQRQGAAGEFLFEDPDDHTVTGQLLGLGDGATTRFQLMRNFGGFVEPFRDVKGVPVVRVGGVAAGPFTIDATGGVVFAAAPGAGLAVSSDFSFYFRVRFKDDQLAGTKFADLLWQTDTVTLRTLKW